LGSGWRAIQASIFASRSGGIRTPQNRGIPGRARNDEIRQNAVAPVRRAEARLKALALKIDLTVDHEVAELTGGEACVAALKRDAARLCLRA